MKSLSITVPEIPPSNNKYLGNSHNFNIYRKEKERWALLIHAALKGSGKPSVPFDKAEVHITYYFKDKRRRDPDNYSGKMLLDPLTREGIIKDDCFDVITLIISGHVDKRCPRTEIMIKDLT